MDHKLHKIKESICDGIIEDPEFSIQDEILFLGHRLVNPKNLQPEILKELYAHILVL